jgi:exopolyphosphatase/guanosine-5'-triphosphate,3'-diphosphate pyrophosphatase
VSGPVAAIDCGTNSTRLLVSDQGRSVERLMRITRLGQGVDGTGRLAPDAIERTVATLAEYRQVMDRLGVQQVRVIATSAARDAANRDEFFQRARQVVGVTPELLSGEEEGRLSFLGATTELDARGDRFLVVDIGGGSTELVAGITEPEGVTSLDVGCVRLSEKYLHHDPPAAEELADALAEVRDYLEDAVLAVPVLAEAPRMVGLAGTVAAVAAVEIGLPSYDRDRIHHFRLTRSAAEDVFRTLATEPRSDRVHNPGLEAARADVIVGGCVVLVGVMRFFGLDSCLVSESDILDGIAMSLTDARVPAEPA